jgi:TDG/mug DNA glycosylase family protein
MIKRGFPPIAGPDTRIFLLGSLPGDRSIAEQRYYAHPTNQFWRLVGGLLELDFSGMNYAGRTAALGESGIGLWDVFDAAHRPGSLDMAIRDARPNPIAALRSEFPRLEAIAFNGAAAAREGHRQFAADDALALLDLPSSSAANTMPFERKLDAWRALIPYLPLRDREIAPD